MVSRKPLIVCLGWLTLVAGCHHSLPGLRTAKGPAAAAGRGEEMVHKASTYVAFGDFRANSAYAPDTPPAAQQQLREDARLSYLKALEVDANHLPAFQALARLQQRGEDYGGAIDTYQKALALHAGDANLWYELAMCQCRQKNWNDAVANLQKAIELSPANTSYKTTLGYTLGRAGRLEEGLAILREVHGEAQALYDLARMLRHMNQADLARQYTARAGQINPNLPGLQQFAAQLNEPVPSSAVQTVAYSEPAGTTAMATTRPQTDTPQAGTPQTAAPLTLALPVVTSATTVPPPQGSPASRAIRLPPLPVIKGRK